MRRRRRKSYFESSLPRLERAFATQDELCGRRAGAHGSSLALDPEALSTRTHLRQHEEKMSQAISEEGHPPSTLRPTTGLTAPARAEVLRTRRY